MLLYLLISSFLWVSVAGLSCPCQSMPVKCTTPPPTDCKGNLTFDVCGCCQVCEKGVNETCGGPFFSAGRCPKGLICKFPDLRFPYQSIGTCQVSPPKKINETCGDAWQQGNCEKGLICKQETPGNLGTCINA